MKKYLPFLLAFFLQACYNSKTNTLYNPVDYDDYSIMESWIALVLIIGAMILFFVVWNWYIKKHQKKEK